MVWNRKKEEKNSIVSIRTEIFNLRKFLSVLLIWITLIKIQPLVFAGAKKKMLSCYFLQSFVRFTVILLLQFKVGTEAWTINACILRFNFHNHFVLSHDKVLLFVIWHFKHIFFFPFSKISLSFDSYKCLKYFFFILISHAHQ